MEDVVTNRRKSVHVQRIRLFAEVSIEVTEDIRTQAAYDDQTHVESLVDSRETSFLGIIEGLCVLVSSWVLLILNRFITQELSAMVELISSKKVRVSEFKRFKFWDWFDLTSKSQFIYGDLLLRYCKNL